MLIQLDRRLLQTEPYKPILLNYRRSYYHKLFFRVVPLCSAVFFPVSSSLLLFCLRVNSFGDRMFLLRGGVCNNALHLFSSAAFISLVRSSSIICLTLCSLVRPVLRPFYRCPFLISSLLVSLA